MNNEIGCFSDGDISVSDK